MFRHMVVPQLLGLRGSVDSTPSPSPPPSPSLSSPPPSSPPRARYAPCRRSRALRNRWFAGQVQVLKTGSEIFWPQLVQPELRLHLIECAGEHVYLLRRRGEVCPQRLRLHRARGLPPSTRLRSPATPAAPSRRRSRKAGADRNTLTSFQKRRSKPRQAEAEAEAKPGCRGRRGWGAERGDMHSIMGEGEVEEGSELVSSV